MVETWQKLITTENIIFRTLSLKRILLQSNEQLSCKNLILEITNYEVVTTYSISFKLIRAINYPVFAGICLIKLLL